LRAGIGAFLRHAGGDGVGDAGVAWGAEARKGFVEVPASTRWIEALSSDEEVEMPPVCVGERRTRRLSIGWVSVVLALALRHAEVTKSKR
jgi:hypothetical protein